MKAVPFGTAFFVAFFVIIKITHILVTLIFKNDNKNQT